jgi:hypothetical protein
MYNGLVHLHNLLRWIILVLLVLSVYQSFIKNPALRKTSLWLMITAHLTLLLGLFQWLNGAVGLGMLDEQGFGGVMANPVSRFWVVEHLTGMIIAIVLVSIARGKAKYLNYKGSRWLYVAALLIILVSIPWPFREAGIGRPWFPGM